MGWLETVRDKDVCLDTAPIIYYIEKPLPDYRKVLDPFFEMVAEGECSAITSIMSLMEGLVLLIRNDDKFLIRRFRNFFYHTRIRMVEITSSVAEEAARLRATYKDLKGADAIQLATALYTKADFFLTNDKRLASISGINVLVLDDLKA